MRVVRGRGIATAIVMIALVAVGGSSTHDAWTGGRPVLKRGLLSVGNAVVRSWPDTGGNREYVLDMLALKYVGDYVDDPRVLRAIGRNFWCGTPLLTESGKIPARERSESALRERAREMARRYKRLSSDLLGY